MANKWEVELDFLGHPNNQVILEESKKRGVLNGITSKCTVDDWEKSDELSGAILMLRDLYRMILDCKISI